MSDIQTGSDEDLVEFLGEHALDMAERLRLVDKIVPGARSTFAFKLNGVVFALSMEVRRG